MKVIPMNISTGYHILSRDSTNRLFKVLTVMTYINEQEETLLDKGKQLKLERGNRIFKISPRDVYCYGEVDFNDTSDDMYTIDSFGFLNYLGGFNGVRIYSNYDYETHTCTSPYKQPMFYETWHPALLAQYAHGCLGKPERIVLFKDTI